MQLKRVRVLKIAMSGAPVLGLPNFDDKFVLGTDSPGSGMCTILKQNGHPICYFSKQLCQAFTYVLLQQQRLVKVHFLALTVPQVNFITKFKESLNLDKDFQALLTKVRDKPTKHKELQIPCCSLRGDMFVPSTSPLKLTLLDEFHSSTIGGHIRIHRTFEQFQENLFSQGMHQDVVQFVKALLHIHTVILVVVDRLSKAAYFGSLPTQFTAIKVVELFVHMVCKLHNMPRSVVSDRDPILLSHFARATSS
ncbi:hypothetical protein KIW84_051214 [Lathyrus oleraceus]|uniref:Integrase zinc-binding domain-containing protein n=1 Tax=Pisum sativum TaxID=3888 RepID=A0A9D4WNJ7_PEA|nr:hypothetical protein KIW84_051214 [Pisum sativum]